MVVAAAASASSDNRRHELLAIQSAFAREAVPLKGGVGAVSIRPMRPEDVKSLTGLIVEAFQGTVDERPRARVAKYLIDLLEPNPEEIVLVGILGGSGSGGGGGEEGEEGGEGGEPVAIVSMSFTAGPKLPHSPHFLSLT